MTKLTENIRFLKGIGETRAKSFERLGVTTLLDLLYTYPRTYEDRTKIVNISDANNGDVVCINALVGSQPTLVRVRRGMELVKFVAVDDSGSIDVTYFNQSYVKNQLVIGQNYIFYGKVVIEKSHRTMTNPVFEKEGTNNNTGRIVPIYSLTSGISQKLISNSIRIILNNFKNELPNYIPNSVSEKMQLCKSGYALENIHFPTDFGTLELARQRLIFEELFVLSSALTMMKETRNKNSGIFVSTPDLRRFYSTLPFTPTSAQKRAIEAATKDMESGSEMNRLIQGDVGSGKTLVAAACIWCVSEGGLQSAFMAPTEILANQHYETLSRMLSPFNIKVEKLTGSMTNKQKRELSTRLKAGEIDLLVGTHALISDSVEFDKLALVITDEQHRFGVNQRSSLISKGHNPHTLVMSATPIPRTLALMIYGDLDVSIINELPPGRQKVDTFVVGEDKRQRIYKFISKHVENGNQVFIVCPAIDATEEQPENFKSAKEYSKLLSEKVFPNLHVACLHGKMKPKEKSQVMQDFLNHNIDILVSTTVVEVGIDVPNATLMVIENSDRFGLSQLHQLRGRVGRGKDKSYCILFTDSNNEETLARLKVMENSNDGFEIAEEDLKLRGPGDFFGSRQHGLPKMRIADFCTDISIMKDAQEAANNLLIVDPNLSFPENRCLKKRINEIFDASETKMN